MGDRAIARVIDLTDPAANRIPLGNVAEARARLASGDPKAVLDIPGSFALVARDGSTVRMARSLDRPMRYFLAKQTDGPALVVADRIDTIHAFLKSEGLDAQFHPTYTRMVPAHHVVTIRLVGCPDPDASYTRFLEPETSPTPSDPASIGLRYVGALAGEIGAWLESLPPTEPLGVCFSGGIDSGAVFLTAYHLMRRLGMPLSRLKAFTLSAGGGQDLEQARQFLDALDLGLFLEPIEVPEDWIDPFEAVRVVEDYKPLDVESAAAALRSAARHPRALPGLAPSPRRRRRRREPQGLSDRGEFRADHPQRRPKPLPLSGGVGRRNAQAFADLLGRTEPLLHAHVRPRAPVRLRGLLSVHPSGAGSDRGRASPSPR